ncbi:GDSL esterase/lipase At5g03980-like [Silene latifolia]|uniref:GDSL esterase/lipase At5g03980-like n=1 Tax=Silene latifolia TaxID=37657 RepID=UPI003D784D94
MASMRSVNFVLLSLLSLSLILPSLANDSSNGKLSFEAIYQFGDSLSDTGNLMRDGPVGAHNPCARLPYGVTSGNNTGRCSDGQLMIDFFANFFHMPHLSPYLNKESDSTYGLNFAVAGSTALDTDRLTAMGIINPATNKSLFVQINWFKSHLKSFCGDNASECKQRVGNSLIIMGETGGNDYNYALLEGKSLQELHDMVPEVVQQIKQAVKEVINLGAMRVVVPGNFPIGCMPIYLSMFEVTDPNQYDSLKCLKGLNYFAVLHNKHLQFAIKELQAEFPHVAIVYGDYFNGLRWILQSATSLGFKEDGFQKACCGDANNKYNFNMNKLCGSEGASVCANPEERYSWDGIHLTQHAYLHMAQYLLKRIVPGILQVV